MLWSSSERPGRARSSTSTFPSRASTSAGACCGSTTSPTTTGRDSAPLAGTPWRELLGLAKSEDGVWELRRPENLTSTWFSRRAGTRQVTPPALRRAEVALTASARAELDLTGSLRNWTRAGTSSAARMSTPDHTSGGDPPPPGSSSSGSIPEPPAYDEDEGEAATTDFHHSLGQLEQGTVAVPSTTWGGAPSFETEIDVEASPDPALLHHPGDWYQLVPGRLRPRPHGKTMTSLPGEDHDDEHAHLARLLRETAQGSSIIDSYDDSSSRTLRRNRDERDHRRRHAPEKSENWHAEADAKGSIGLASASVSGGGGRRVRLVHGGSSRKPLTRRCREHTAEASSHRENTVTSSSERHGLDRGRGGNRADDQEHQREAHAQLHYPASSTKPSSPRRT